MSEQRSAIGPLLGFLVFEKTTNHDGFIGALMVTDNRGYPLEFRATTPVKPSLVQRTLYGRQLENYVGVELCGRALLGESQRRPKVVLVPDRALLDVGDGVDADIVAIWRAGESLKVEDEGVATSRGTIKSPGQTGQPLVYEGRFIAPDSERASLMHLEDCARHFDLPEAFERMRTALELLGNEDPRYA